MAEEEEDEDEIYEKIHGMKKRNGVWMPISINIAQFDLI